MAEVECHQAVASGEYRLSRHGAEQAQARRLVAELAERDLVKFEELADELLFSFAPMIAQLSATWRYHLEHDAAGPQGPATGDGQGARLPSDHASPLRHAEQKLGRPLSPREIQDLFDWIDLYGFPPDIAAAVIDEACEQGKPFFNYMNSIAREWYTRNVKSLEDVQRIKEQHRQVTARQRQVARYLGLSRKLTQAEEQLLSKWSGTWGFSDEVILKACEATVHTREPSFAYVDRVLENWHRKGVRTVDDAVRALQLSPRPANRKTPPQRGRPAGVKPASESRKEAGFYDDLVKRRPK
jgi:DnaD/phage-associated family protein